MKKQFQQVRHLVQDLNYSSRQFSSSVISSITNLTKKDEKEESKIFGVLLDEHLRSTDREISVVIESCIAFLLDFLEEEGLFRIPGSSSEVKRLKSGFEAGLNDLTNRVRDPHAVAGTLKSYLRELPEPLLTHTMCDGWMDAAKINDNENRLQALKQVCDQLPKNHHVNLRYLIRFLDKLSQYSDANKMSSQNIAMSLTPSLIWSPSANDDSFAIDMSATNHHSVIVYSLVSNALFFFPEDIQFTTLESFACQDRTRHSAPSEQVTFESSCSSFPPPPRTPKRTPKKPAPPPLVCDDHYSLKSTTTGSNNNIYHDSQILSHKESSSPMLPRRKGFSSRRDHSSSETLDVMSSSFTAGYDTRSLDRKEVLRRNSDKSSNSTTRKVINRRSAIPVPRPSVPPPAVPLVVVDKHGEPSISGLLLKDSTNLSTSEQNLNLVSHKNSTLHDSNNESNLTNVEVAGAGHSPQSSVTDASVFVEKPLSDIGNDVNVDKAVYKNEENISPIPKSLVDIPKKPPRGVKNKSPNSPSNRSASSDIDTTLHDSTDNIIDSLVLTNDIVETRSLTNGRLSSTDGSIDELDNIRPVLRPRKPPRKTKSASTSNSMDTPVNGESSVVDDTSKVVNSNATINVLKPPKPLPPPKPKLKGENSYL